LARTEVRFGAPAGENPPVPPDTDDGPADPDKGGTDPSPDPSEDAPGTDEGHPESPTKGRLLVG
jgi:hypothetical protein